MNVNSVGPNPGASQFVGGSTLPANPESRSTFLKNSGGSEGLYICITDGSWVLVEAGTGAGTVQSVSVVSANGQSGSVANPTTTPAITLNNPTALACTQSLAVGAVGGATGSVLFKGVTSGTVTVKPADAAGTWSLTLPTNDGDSGQYLQTNGSGVSSWQTVTAGITNSAGANTVPKSDGTNLVASQISDDGTTVALNRQTIGVGQTTTGVTDLLINPTTKASGNLIDAQVNSVSKFSIDFSGRVFVLSGTVSAPGVNIGGIAGLYNSGAGFLDVALSGTRVYALGNNGFYLLSNSVPIFFGASFDTTISRNAAGILQIGTTAANASGSLLATNGTFSGTLASNGNLSIATAKLLSIASGTNQRAGNATLVAGTVTVSNATVTANTIVMLTRKTTGGTIGTAITYTVSAGASFTINSDNPLDTSSFSYFLVEVP